MPATVANPRNEGQPARAANRAAPADAWVALDRIGVVVTLRRDEPLFLAGDAADSYYKVLKGAVRTCQLLADGRRHVADFFLAGDFIALDAGENHPVLAEAIVETTLIRYSRRKVDALALEQPVIAQSLVEIMRASLAAARERMLMLGHMTAMERIASFLIGMSNRDTNRRINLPMNRTDIGDYLGLTMETVSRTLSQLKSDGIIVQRSMHEMTIADRVALVDLTRP